MVLDCLQVVIEAINMMIQWRDMMTARSLKSVT